MATNDDHVHRRPQTAVELANDGDLVATEVLQGELLDAETDPRTVTDGPVLEAVAAADPAEAASTQQPTHVERPTIRWGALVWGLLFAASAAFVFWTLAWSANRDQALAAAMELNPISVVLYGLLAIGVVVVLFGIVGLIRRGERRRRLARD
ncbi:hypothetical protein MUN74_05885 [Agromyces endophyticus]|uniref:hypothetical protein n=1 Tax=Agromyces sp. H17E-10 TaxID=2932244 RepID=UPI001FCFE23F|nr:hypothetical protein [Agromyces sp. H17E-10]UOQ90445.1 hypothetical protein MUN74_05885 [Agromyces sp. H17E-10]